MTAVCPGICVHTNVPLSAPFEEMAPFEHMPPQRGGMAVSSQAAARAVMDLIFDREVHDLISSVWRARIDVSGMLPLAGCDIRWSARQRPGFVGFAGVTAALQPVYSGNACQA